MCSLCVHNVKENTQQITTNNSYYEHWMMFPVPSQVSQPPSIISCFPFLTPLLLPLEPYQWHTFTYMVYLLTVHVDNWNSDHLTKNNNESIYRRHGYSYNSICLVLLLSEQSNYIAWINKQVTDQNTVFLVLDECRSTVKTENNIQVRTSKRTQ
jgi:hypothetical protein